MITTVVSGAGYSFYIDGVLATAGRGRNPANGDTGQSSSLTVGGRGTGYGGTTKRLHRRLQPVQRRAHPAQVRVVPGVDGWPTAVCRGTPR